MKRYQPGTKFLQVIYKNAELILFSWTRTCCVYKFEISIPQLYNSVLWLGKPKNAKWCIFVRRLKLFIIRLCKILCAFTSGKGWLPSPMTSSGITRRAEVNWEVSPGSPHKGMGSLMLPLSRGLSWACTFGIQKETAGWFIRDEALFWEPDDLGFIPRSHCGKREQDPAICPLTSTT